MNIDLNLLRVFDLLMELRSVTRAADRLGMSQSAVSQALARLRDALDDPLFTRTRTGLQPTSRAVAIAPGVREALEKMASALGPREFDPSRSRRHFTIAAGSYFCSHLVPRIMARACQTAPEVTFRIVPMGEQIIEGLDYGTIDVALGAFPGAPPRFEFELLFNERMAWIAAVGSELARAPFDAQRVASMPRVRITIDFDAPEYAAEHNRSSFSGEPNVLERTVYDSLTALAIVAKSDLVALAPRRMAQHHSEFVTIIGPDEDGRVLPLGMLWHAQQRADRGLTWLRDLIREICAGGG